MVALIGTAPKRRAYARSATAAASAQKRSRLARFGSSPPTPSNRQSPAARRLVAPQQAPLRLGEA